MNNNVDQNKVMDDTNFLIHNLAKLPKRAEGKIVAYKIEQVRIRDKISSNNAYTVDDLIIIIHNWDHQDLQHTNTLYGDREEVTGDIKQ